MAWYLLLRLAFIASSLQLQVVTSQSTSTNGDITNDSAPANGGEEPGCSKCIFAASLEGTITVYRNLLIDSFLNPEQQADAFNATDATKDRFKRVADETIDYYINNPSHVITASGRYLDTMVGISSYIIGPDQDNAPSPCQKCSLTGDAYKALEQSIYNDMTIKSKRATCALWEEFKADIGQDLPSRNEVCGQTDDFAMEEGWFGMFAHELMRLNKETETITGYCMDECDCFLPIDEIRKEQGFWDNIANNMMNNIFSASVQDSIDNAQMLEPQYDSWKGLCADVTAANYTEFVRPFVLIDDRALED